jgi:hypothetical protein
VGLEQGPLSLVSITEELLEWNSSGCESRELRLTAVRIRCTDQATPSIRKSSLLTSPTCGGPSVSIVRLRTKATEFRSVTFIYIIYSKYAVSFYGNERYAFVIYYSGK